MTGSQDAAADAGPPSTPGRCHEEPETEIPRHGILVNGIIGNEELGH